MPLKCFIVLSSTTEYCQVGIGNTTEVFYYVVRLAVLRGMHLKKEPIYIVLMQFLSTVLPLSVRSLLLL